MNMDSKMTQLLVKTVNGIKMEKIMKKILMPLMLIVSMLSACSDDKEPIIENPIQVGDEIQFGAALPNEAKSRTIYGDDVYEQGGKKYFPLYWKDKDEIAIFSPQASQPVDKWAKYQVRVSNATSSAAETLVRLGDCGLQWGNADMHEFHAIYPASLVKEGTNWQNGLNAVLPAIQHAVVQYNVKQGVHVASPDMNNALMYAYNTYDRTKAEAETPIQLAFKPLASVLDITVNGPSKGNLSEEVVINSILVIAKSKIATSSIEPKIAGDFVVNFGENVEGVTCTVPKDDSRPAANTSSVNISLGTQGVTLKQGEKLHAKAFLIPDAEQLKNCTFQIRVSVSKGGFARTKIYKDMVVDPGKITRVNLPNLDRNLDVNYWMTELDPRVYLTEISVPGSKMSVLTKDNGASLVYQNSTIEEQFKAGVRGFILHTLVAKEGRDYKLYVACDRKQLMPLEEAIEDISNYLKVAENSKKHEYAFVMITYAQTGANTDWDGMNEAQRWLVTLRDEAYQMKGNSRFRIYSNKITENTTLGDVANQIVLKVNTNDGYDMYKYWYWPYYYQDAPMLFSEWKEKQIYGKKALPWGKPKFENTKLTWQFQEVTTVENSENLTSAEATLDGKIRGMNSIFQESLNNYAGNNNHNIWYMNDLGGYMTNPSSTAVSPTMELAKVMNAEAIKVLSNRDKNASLGLVFMNFADRGASAQECRSDFLIQTIIDNNFKFNLRMRGNVNGTRTVAPFQISEDPNEWDK